MKWITSILTFLLLSGCTSPRKHLPTTTSKLHKVRTYSARELGVTLVPSQSGQAVRWSEKVSSPGRVQLPMLPPSSPHARQPYISGHLNGSVALPLSIDTGAAFTVLNERDALAAGVRMADPSEFKNTFVGIGGSEENFYGLIDELRLGELVFRNVFCVVRPATDDAPMDNVLGMASLAKLPWFLLDYPNRAVTFATSGPPPSLNEPLSVPFNISSLQMHTELAVNDEFQFLAMIDTGNDAPLMFSMSLLREIGLGRDAQNGTPGRHGGAGGVVDTKTFDIAKITLGSRPFTNVSTVAVPNNFPPTIGSGFFSDYAMVVDLTGRRILLGRTVSE